MRWVVAIESGNSSESAGGPLQLPVRLHAYDLLDKALAHPMGARYDVAVELLWEDSDPGRRCKHCVDIVESGSSSG